VPFFLGSGFSIATLISRGALIVSFLSLSLSLSLTHTLSLLVRDSDRMRSVFPPSSLFDSNLEMNVPTVYAPEDVPDLIFFLVSPDTGPNKVLAP